MPSISDRQRRFMAMSASPSRSQMDAPAPLGVAQDFAAADRAQLGPQNKPRRIATVGRGRSKPARRRLKRRIGAPGGSSGGTGGDGGNVGGINTGASRSPSGIPSPLNAPPGIPIGFGPVTGKGPPQYGEPYPGAGPEYKADVDAREKKTEEFWKRIWRDRDKGKLGLSGFMR